jgi:hypothetical protein
MADETNHGAAITSSMGVFWKLSKPKQRRTSAFASGLEEQNQNQDPKSPCLLYMTID